MKTKTCHSILFDTNNSQPSSSLRNEKEILRAFQEFSFPIFEQLRLDNVENPPTSLAQPLILLQSYLLYEMYLEKNQINKSLKMESDEKIICMLGHSLGEFTAMAACGGLTIEEAMKMVYMRGLSMEKNITKDQQINMSMKAIINIPSQLMNDIEEYLKSGISSQLLLPCCDMANINTPQQVVLSGTKSDIENQISIWQENYKTKLKGLPLNVHLPFHSKYLKPVANDLSEVYSDIGISQRQLKYPIVANINAKFVQNFEEMVKLSIDQVYSPVLWNLSMKSIIEHVIYNYLVKEPDNTFILRFIEFGPQKKLEPMVSKCCQGTNLSKFKNLTIESISFNTFKDIDKYFQS